MTGTPPPDVNLSGECGRILRQVPEPEPQEGDHLLVVAAEYKVALREANRRIVKGAQCEAAQRERYRKAGK